jgi:hypothetical protein
MAIASQFLYRPYSQVYTFVLPQRAEQQSHDLVAFFFVRDRRTG